MLSVLLTSRLILQTHLLLLPTSFYLPWSFFSYLRAFAHAALPARNDLPVDLGIASLQISGQMFQSLLKETFPNYLIK